MNGEKGGTAAANGTSGAPDMGVQLATTQASIRSFARGLNITDADITETTSIDAVIRAVGAEVTRLRTLEPLAADGAKLRKALIEEAVREGARASGEGYDAAAKQRMLENLDIDTISEMRDTWRGIGDAKLAPATKRSSADAVDADAAPGAEGDDKGENGEGEGTGAEGEVEAHSNIPEDTEGGV